MMNSQTYVSDPRIWESFYKNMAEKKFNPYKYKQQQIGKGVRSYKSYVIPLRPHSQLKSEEEGTSTHVTPVAAVEERAKVEHFKDVKEGVPFVRVQGGIKRPRSQSFAISSKKLKRATCKTQTKKSSKPATKKSTQAIKTKSVKKQQQRVVNKKKQTRKKKQFQIDSYRSIFKL